MPKQRLASRVFLISWIYCIQVKCGIWMAYTHICAIYMWSINSRMLQCCFVKCKLNKWNAFRFQNRSFFRLILCNAMRLSTIGWLLHGRFASWIMVIFSHIFFTWFPPHTQWTNSLVWLYGSLFLSLSLTHTRFLCCSLFLSLFRSFYPSISHILYTNTLIV